MNKYVFLILLSGYSICFLQASDTSEINKRAKIFNAVRQSVIFGSNSQRSIEKLLQDEKYCKYCNDQDQHGDTLLYSSIKSFNLGAALTLLEGGVSVHVTNNLGLTPLHYAMIFHVNDIITQKLLDAGSDVQAKDYFGVSLLHRAVVNESVTDVRELISRGADVNSQDNNGNSILKEAVDSGKVSIVRELLHAHVKIEDDFLDENNRFLYIKPEMRTILGLYIEASKTTR